MSRNGLWGRARRGGRPTNMAFLPPTEIVNLLLVLTSSTTTALHDLQLKQSCHPAVSWSPIWASCSEEEKRSLQIGAEKREAKIAVCQHDGRMDEG